MQKTIKNMLYKKMSRKEFLRVTALGFASIVGFSHLIKIFEGKDTKTLNTSGYGSSPYGGSKRS